MTTELKGPTHAVDIWAEYEKKIEHWRPVFGNTEHIRACTAIEQINRMTPLYARAAAEYEDRRNAAFGLRTVPHKRLDKLRAELTALKSVVLEIIKS
jgi:hypothetical protein